MKIEGCRALVSGGNRGIGEAFVRALLDAGAARVYVGSRAVGGAAHIIDAAPDRAVEIELDVTDDAQVGAAAKRCDDVNLVVNNAGLFADRRLIGADDIQGARAEMEVNYFGTLRMCRAFAPVLAEHDESAIVNVLSSAAIVSVPVMGGYSPSKFAARALSTSVRAELAKQRTQVIALIVGSVDTRMAAQVEGAKEPPETIALAGLRAVREGIPELDTDPFAEAVRAGFERAPEKLERNLAAMLDQEGMSTGR